MKSKKLERQFFNNNNEAVSLDGWRSRAKKQKCEKEWSQYFSSLDFHQLVVEAEHIFKELQEKNFDSELANQSQLLLLEIQQRIEDFSKERGSDVASFRKNLDLKIVKLIASH